MPLTVLNCSVTTDSVTITFSEPVDSASAIILSNYTVFDPPGMPSLIPLASPWKATLPDPAASSTQSVTLTYPLTSSAPFSPGDYVLISVSGITQAGNQLPPTNLSAQVPTSGLSVVDCSVTTNSITITFSEPVDQNSAFNQANYTVYDPPAFSTPTLLDPNWKASWPDNDSLTVQLATKVPPFFSEGDYVLVGISGITDQSGNPLPPTDLSAQVPYPDGEGRVVRDVEDAISYPILTEEIGYRPSPVGLPSGGGGGISGGGARSSLGQVALQTVTDVLGWKANNADPKGFIGALTQAFTLTEVEGHVQSTWVPRTYAVQTDLGGGISGAQASLYMRAKDAIEQSITLLDGLYPLDPDADPEYVKALREMARSQMTEILKEFGAVGLPSILRIDTYFNILLGQNPAQNPQVNFNPDLIQGTLGQIRDTYGIRFANNRFNNSVADEEDITNFRVISDYMTSLMQSWLANRDFFILGPDNLAFFGTQLVLISRQFNVIAETVNEVRFTLDSVFIGPSERQTLLLRFADPSLSPMFLEDVLDEIEKFVTDEGPRLLRDGGRISVTNNILPVVESLQNMVLQAHNPTNLDQLPDGFQTARVRNSLDDLSDQLVALINLTEPVEQQVPPSLEDLVLAGVKVSGSDREGYYTLSLLGDNIQIEADVLVSSITPVSLPRGNVTFYSAQRIDLKVHPRLLRLEEGDHHITVKNPKGPGMTLLNAFTYYPKTGTLKEGSNPKAQRVSSTRRIPQRKSLKSQVRQRPKGRSYPVVVDMGGRQGAIATAPVAATAQQSQPAPVVRPVQQLQPAQPAGLAKSVQDLHAVHADLSKKVDEQSQHINEKLESIFEHLKNFAVGRGPATDAKPAQPSEQQPKKPQDK